MRYPILLIIAGILIISSFTSGYPLISDGSFEQNCTSSTYCNFGTGTGSPITIGNSWTFSNIGGQSFLDVKDNPGSPIATSGSYYGELGISPSISNGPNIINSQILIGGQFIYDVNLFNFNHTGNGAIINFNYSDSSGQKNLFTSSVKATVEGNNKTFLLPNYPGRLQLVLSTSGFAVSDSNFIFDNFRWNRYPIILTNQPPFTSHILSNQSFQIDVNYSSGFTCTVTDTNSLQSYSTTEIDSGIYESAPISINVGNNVSSIHLFTTTCGGQINSDNTWKVKVEKYPLISSNGGFDVNGNVTTNIADTTTAIKDWEFTTGGGNPGEYRVIDNNSFSGKISTDGTKYLRLSGGLGGQTGRIKTLTSIKGGTIYYDVNDFNPGDAGGTFQIVMQFDAGGSQTLVNTATGLIGNDRNVIIPNQFGKLLFIVPAGSSFYPYILIDNIRYTNSPTTLSISSSPQYPLVNQNILFSASYLDTNSVSLLNADCNITLDDPLTHVPVTHHMDYNSTSSVYQFSQAFHISGGEAWSVVCAKDTYFTQNASAIVNVYDTSPTLSPLIVTDITNVSHTYTYLYDSNFLNFIRNDVNFIPGDQTNQIIFSLENTNSSSVDVNLGILNSLTDGRQYWIYTANQSQYSLGNWVFNDTLTFGATSSTPIQKIWNGSTYLYSFSDSLGNGEKKYYKISYLAPYKHYFSIGNNTDWLNLLEPTVIDANGINADKYSISSFSNIRSVFIQHIPDITENEINTAGYELQFTAWSSVASTPIYSGYVNYNIDKIQDTINLTTIPHRYSVSIDGNNFNSQIFLKTLNNSFASVFITDYALVPRGYFTKRLKLYKENGDPLDLFLLLGNSEQYITEGMPFKISTQAYDFDGKIENLTIEAFFENTNQDVNQVQEVVLDQNSESEKTFDFGQTIPGIVDLNGNAINPTSPRNLTIKTTLLDSDGVAFAEQSQIIKFVQFPYFGGDFKIDFFPTEKRKGKNPSGVVQINTTNIDALQGLDIRIYDQNSSLGSPDYQKVIYKGTDFTCLTALCSFQIKIDDFLYEDANLAHFVITGLLNTEYFSLSNPLIQVDRTIFLSQIGFDTAKIYQTIERTNADVHQANKYNNTEEIPLFLALRSTDKDNLNNQILTYLTLENCNTDGNFLGTGNCTSQTTKWYPTGHIYDDKFGYNIYYFRNIFLLDNGQLLPDGNYIGFHAHVTDPKGIINPIVPVLAPRCNNQGIIDLAFFPMAGLSALSNLAGFTNGCQLGTQSDVVTTTQNSNQEIRIHISNSYTPQTPAFPAQFCLAPDTNNVVADSMKQDLLCLVTYTVSEKPIDNFRFRLGNEFSDYSNTGSNRQYVEFNLPYELVSYNDPLLLKAELESKGSSITTVGDFYYETLKDAAIGIANATGFPQKADFILGNGLIPNIGGDVNTAALNQAFSATTVSGVMLIDIKGAPVVNAQDYKYDSKISSNFDAIDRKNFLSYLQKKGVVYKTLVPAQMNVILSDITYPIKLYDTNGAILIDELPTVDNINQNNVDQNKTTPYGNKVPAIISLTLNSTMFFNNFSQTLVLSNILNIYAFFFQTFLNGIFGFVNGAQQNPGDAISNSFKEHAVWIFIGLGLVIGISLIRKNLGAGGQ